MNVVEAVEHLAATAARAGYLIGRGEGDEASIAAMREAEATLRTTLFADQLGDPRCNHAYPYYREGWCWPHRYDDTYDDPSLAVDPCDRMDEAG